MNILQQIRSGAFWNSVGFISRFVIGLVSSILFVRLLGQESYGVVTFIMSCVFFLGILVNLGFGTVMTKTIAENRVLGGKSPLYSMLGKVTLLRIMIVGMLTPLFFYSESLALFFGKPWLDKLLYFVPFIVISSYYQGTFKTILVSYYKQKEVNLTLIWEMVLKLVFVLIAVYFDHEVVGFLLAIFASQLITGSRLAWQSMKDIFSTIKEKTVFRVTPQLPLAFHSFLIAISVRLLGRESDIFLLGALHHDIRQVAIYAVVFGLPSMVFELFRSSIGGGLGLTAFTEQIKRGEMERLKEGYFNILQFFSIALFPAIIGGMMVGGDLASLIYGKEYDGLSLMIGILFFSLGISAINSVLSDLLFALNRGRDLMFCQFGFGLLNVLINIRVIPEYGAYGVAVTTGVISFTMTLTEFVLVHRQINPRYPWKYWGRYLLIAIMMGLLIAHVPGGCYGKIPVGILSYIVLFSIQEYFFEKGRLLKFLFRRKEIIFE